jgi:hypothetical protein
MFFEKTYKRLSLVLVGGAFCTANLAAQSQKDVFDYDFLKNRDAWLQSENASGLNNVAVPKISVAEIDYNKSNGDFINYFQSNNSYRYGAFCESYYRLNAKTVVFGKVEYSRFSGLHMGGSSSIDPYFNPLNIVEYADSTAGRKVNETYHLVGALSTKLNDRLSLGLKADYTTESYYKVKDLRHTNDLMNLIFTGGLRYKVNSFIDAGINYYYRRSTEGIEFKSLGVMNKQFNSLIDFGAFYGHPELFGSSGYTADNNLFLNQFNGASIQLNLFPQSKISIFNEFGIKRRTGYFGVKSSATLVRTEHQSDIFSYSGMISFKSHSSIQQLKVAASVENLQNSENSFRAETTTGGVTTYVFYAKNKVFDQDRMNFSVGYTGYFQVEHNNPLWVVDALFTATSDDQTITLYPSFRKHKVNQSSAHLSVKRNVYLASGDILCLNLQAGYGSGSGYAAKDGVYSSAGSSQSSAVSLDRDLYREFEYLTADRIIGTVAVRYTKLLETNKTSIYGEVGYDATKALSVKYIGSTFGNLSVKIGYNF